MFWRRSRRRAPATPATALSKSPDGDAAAAVPSHSYDDSDYWERERLNPWGPAQRAEEQRWARRRTEDADRARVVADAVRAAGQCDVAADATVAYAAGFLAGVGLVTPAEFDARVDRAARVVVAVGDARVPVAFDARDVVRSLTAAGLRNGAGLFQSDLVTCLMAEADAARVRALAKAASDREIARFLFQTPRVKPAVDAYGVWGIAPVRPGDRESWVLPKGAEAASGPGLRRGSRPPLRPVRSSPWDRYVDMYGSADDVCSQEDRPGECDDDDDYSDQDEAPYTDI